MILDTTSSLAAVAIASLVRGGGRKAPMPPPPPDDTLLDAFMKLNEPLRFFISGNIGNIIFFYLERITFSLLNKANGLPSVVKEYIDSVSFFIAYTLQVVPQHYLHALLVYGLDSIDTTQKYLTTLAGCYSAYTASLIGSTFLNIFFVKTLSLDKTLSFVLTLWTFAVINYFFIGYIVKLQKDQDQPKAVMDARKAAKEAQRAINEAKKKELLKAKLVEAKMKERANQAQLKAKALEEKMKAKAVLDKQKAKEKALKEKERAKAKAEKEMAEAKKKTNTKVKEVGNKARNNAKRAVKTRGGAMPPVRFHTTLGSRERLHSFVLSVGKSVEIDNE